MKNYFNILAALILLASCSLTPDYKKPEINLSKGWQNDELIGPREDIMADWWTKFQSPEMDRLIEKARQNNKDVQASLERIEQARLAAVVAGAALYPSVNASANAGRSNEYFINNNAGTGNGFSPVTNTTSAQVSASYEIDLWGKNHASRNAAIKQYQASQYDYSALELVTISDTATAYLNLIAYDERIKIAEGNLANAQKILKIIQARFDNGINSKVELLQEQITVANFESNLASIRQQRNAYFTQLAVLTGETPERFSVSGEDSLDDIELPGIANVQPAEIVSRRPDIAAAEANLEAANFNIGVARAAIYPSLDITLNSTLNSISSPESFANSLIGSVAQPLYQGGALKAAVSSDESRKRELAASYYGLALNSLKEIEDAFALLQSAGIRVKTGEKAVAAAKQANELGLERFKSGITDFQTMIDVQNNLLSAQESLISARLDELTAAVTLFKVMGGGWKESN